MLRLNPEPAGDGRLGHSLAMEEPMDLGQSSTWCTPSSLVASFGSFEGPVNLVPGAQVSTGAKCSVLGGVDKA